MLNTKVLRVTLLTLTVLIIAACGNFQNMSGRTVGSGDHAVTVTNSSGTRVCYLFVSPSTSDSWGDDLLGSSGVLEAGGQITARVAQSGAYDLMAVTQDSAGNCTENGEQITEMGFEINGTVSWTIQR